MEAAGATVDVPHAKNTEAEPTTAVKYHMQGAEHTETERTGLRILSKYITLHAKTVHVSYLQN